MYYNDISVTIQEAFSVQVGLINRILIPTHEAAIPFMKLSGASASTELKTWLTANTKTAPLLEKAVLTATTQSDSSGNPITPDYIYVCGAVVATWDTATDISALTTVIEANTKVESDFWAIIAVDYNAKFLEWAVTFCNAKSKGFFIDVESKAFVIDDLKKSKRVYAIYNGKTGDQTGQQFSAGVAGRCITPSGLTGFKFKTITGITGYTGATLTDAEVSTLATNGVNTYIQRFGRSSLDGSFTTDSDGTQKVVSHIDQVFVRDNIKYNLIKNIYYWLNQSELASMDDFSELESVVNDVLNFFVDNQFISTIDGVKQFTVSVPLPTSQDRAERVMKGTFSYLPNNAIEWVTITGQEVLDVIGGEE